MFKWKIITKISSRNKNFEKKIFLRDLNRHKQGNKIILYIYLYKILINGRFVKLNIILTLMFP